jgi:hypothetical protein
MRVMALSLAEWIKLITAAALWPARSEPANNQFVVATEVIVHQRSSLFVQERFGVDPRSAFAKVVHHGFDVLVGSCRLRPHIRSVRFAFARLDHLHRAPYGRSIVTSVDRHESLAGKLQQRHVALAL